MRLHTRSAGIIGWPVGHSRSPALHGAWLKRYEIADGAYVKLPVRPEDLAARLRELPGAGFVGANLTIPHKEAGLALCTKLLDSARRAGAVNTLVFENGGVTGLNTDGFGFVKNLKQNKVNLHNRPALILGAGGAARAIGAALQDEGLDVTFCNRSTGRAALLTQALAGTKMLAFDRLSVALKDYGLLVNATSLGMVGQPPLAIDLAAASAGLVVADIVYAPLETPLLAAARARGLVAVDGLGMLLHQAALGFQLWFGVAPVVDEDLYKIVAAA
jgi:shikimate dehydrogenase